MACCTLVQKQVFPVHPCAQTDLNTMLYQHLAGLQSQLWCSRGRLLCILFAPLTLLWLASFCCSGRGTNQHGMYDQVMRQGKLHVRHGMPGLACQHVGQGLLMLLSGSKLTWHGEYSTLLLLWQIDEHSWLIGLLWCVPVWNFYASLC